MSWSVRIATLKKGAGAAPPDPPDGYVYITDADGAILTDSDGTYLITEA